MEPLTSLQQKVAEAHGLAIAAAEVTAKVTAVVDDTGLQEELETLHGDAGETRARCLRAGQRLGEETAGQMLAHANTIAERMHDLAGAWFKAGTDPLAAWSFLAMGEAAEVATWLAVTRLAVDAKDAEVAALAAWALPVQQRHLSVALGGSARLAEHVDGTAPRFG